MLHGLAGGESDHGFADDGDADVVGEAAGDFFAIDKAHTWRVSLMGEGQKQIPARGYGITKTGHNMVNKGAQCCA